MQKRRPLAQSASLAFEQYLGIPHSHLQSVFPHHAEQDGAILRHIYDRQSRFLEFQAQGKTYFASPWMLARPGEGATRPGVLLFQSRGDTSVEPVGHARFLEGAQAETLLQRVQSLATMTQEQFRARFRSTILPAP